MKKLILFISLIILMFSANAQSSAFCEGAIVFPNSNSCFNNQTFTGNEQWYSFVAEETIHNIFLENLNASIAHIHRIEFYTGTCAGNNLVLSDSVEVSPSNDTLLALNETGLTIGNTYYIKLIKGEDGCVKCTNVGANYDLCLMPIAGPASIDVTTSNGYTNNCTGTLPCNLITICANTIVCLDASQGSSTPGGTTIDWTLPFAIDASGIPIPTGTTTFYGSPLCIQYSTPGVYDVSCTVTIPGDAPVPTSIYTITVVPEWTASFTSSPNPGCNLFPINMTNTTGPPPITYGIPAEIWSFPGGFSCGVGVGTQCVDYNTPGTYIVTLTMDNGFCEATATQSIVVTNTIPLFSYTTVCVGQPTVFTDISTCVAVPSNYFWDFGDGTTSTLQNPSHIFPSAGTYNVMFTVDDPINGPVSVTITVIVNPLPTFVITGSTTSCSGTPVNYTVSPLVGGMSYTWSTTTGSSGTGPIATAGDGTGGTFINFYPNGGTITFTGTNTATGCSYTTSLYVGSCCSPPAIPTFTNKNTSAIAYLGVTSGTTITLTNQTIAINGTFNVNQSLTLIGCDLRMGYLAKVIVDPGMTLTITNNGNDKTHIYACNEMWDGIYVSTPTSLVVINNGSTVEDALSAVVSDNKGNFQIDGNLGQGNVIFNKNYKSIVVKNALTGSHPGYVRATTIQCYDGVVGGNPTNTLNKLHFPRATERSSTGVELTNINNINIGLPIPIKLNTFDNLDFGINSSNSTLSVYNNAFKNITSTGPPPAKGIECPPGTAICAKGGKTVVRTLIVGSISSIPAYKNTFTNGFKGVVATEFMNVSIWKNTFTNITNTGIRVSKNYLNTLVINQNNINNSPFGIDCFDNQSANITIDNNDINAGSLLNASGILAQEIIAGVTVYKFTRNTIRNVRNGVIVSGLKNSEISRNNVYLKHTTIPSLECYGVRLVNSSLCSIVANWVLGTNPANTWVHGISLNDCMSDYVTCNESNNLGTGMFFGGVQTPNTYIAKNLMNINSRGLVLNVGEVGPQYTPGTSNKPNDNRWTGSFTWHTYSVNSIGALSPFYVRTSAGPSTLPFNPIPYLKNATPSGPPFEIPLVPTPGNLNSLACPVIIPTGGGGPPHKPLMLQIAGDSIVPAVYDASTRWILKQSLYQYLKVDPTLISTEPLIAQFKNDYSTNNMGKLDDVETVLSDLSSVTPSVLTSIQNLNNTVVPASDVETNSKWMNNLLIENALIGGDYSSAQINALRLLAEKCPYNDGPAVYQARVILSQIEDIEYLNICEMAIESSLHSMTAFSQPDEPLNNDFKLFPNPNDGTMNFIYSLNETSFGEMIIYDITGKIVSQYSLSTGLKNQILINETQLSNGIYFYKVIIDSEIKVSDKIVIIK